MRLIDPITVTDAILTASTVAENDHAEWDVATGYVAGSRVIVLSTHRVYEAVTSTTGDDPTTDDGTNWIDVGATNRWRAFDDKISDLVTNSGSISYTFEPASRATGLCCFGLDADSVRVEVSTAAEGSVYDTTTSLVDATEVYDWYSFFFRDLVFANEVLFEDLPPYLAPIITVTINKTGGTAAVGEVIFGERLTLAATSWGSQISFDGFSTIETDTFGNTSITERPAISIVRFDFTAPATDTRRIIKALSDRQAQPTVFYANADSRPYGALVFGLAQPNDITLEGPSAARGSLEVQGFI